jgi:ERCC4-type nuclease
MRIVVDDRERRSGIIDYLRDAGAEVSVRRLLYGDYLIGGQLVVERKTAHDFPLSVMSGRVFRQIRELKKLRLRVALLIEGNPYKTACTIKPVAIRGAILSIASIWQMPVIFSESTQDSAAIFQILAGQLENARTTVPQRTILRPKKLINRQLYIIQGLPGVGAKLSHRMLSHFKTVSGVFSAAPGALVEVDGLGAEKARQIREALDTVFEG